MNTMTTQLQRAGFGWDGMDEDVSLPGYDLTPVVGNMNGFNIPAFEKAVADKICVLCSDYPTPTVYNEAKDVYEQAVEEGSTEMAEVGVPALYPTVDGEKKLYSFHTSGWTWMKDEV